MQKIKDFVATHEQQLSFGALLSGFLVDNFTLSRIDLWLDNIILFSYLLVAGFSIILINTWRRPFVERWIPYAMQFAFGGLFSGYVIFYSKSATLAGSWPFIVMLAILLLGNEFFKERYQRLIFQMSIFFVAVFSFLIFFLPVVIGEMGASIFLLSGATSLLVIWLFIKLLALLTSGATKAYQGKMKASIVGIFLAFNLLYFTNIIPPIPLSLKELDVHYAVEREGQNYIVYSEDTKWFEFYKRNTYQHIDGEPLSSFSAVFAPTRLTEQITHKWSYFDEESESWILLAQISFPITGGRDGGYRGYSVKKNVFPGQWRVDVVTERDQILGRKNFRVVAADDIPPLVAEIK
ncbi:DUF2914 domain-containing protein [Patescibacteria group bacterium]|nr:DUF2914 domain-containing protein [Patescibacteria group bacterium]